MRRTAAREHLSLLDPVLPGDARPIRDPPVQVRHRIRVERGQLGKRYDSEARERFGIRRGHSADHAEVIRLSALGQRRDCVGRRDRRDIVCLLLGGLLVGGLILGVILRRVRNDDRFNARSFRTGTLVAARRHRTSNAGESRRTRQGRRHFSAAGRRIFRRIIARRCITRLDGLGGHAIRERGAGIVNRRVLLAGIGRLGNLAWQISLSCNRRSCRHGRSDVAGAMQ